MSLILSYNDGLPKGKRRVPNIRKEPHIERGFTRFKLDYGKCRSYLDIHLPIWDDKSMCELTDSLIERCRMIMIRLLYRGSMDRIEDVLDLSYHGWTNSSNVSKNELFIGMFLKESISIVIQFSDNEHDVDYYTFGDLLTDDEKYADFNRYWQDCSISALLTTLTLSSRRILNESIYFSAGFPREISEKIICHAFDMLD